MNIIFKGTYKSIGPFEWEDIPKFTVMTGPNGCGKSHLLELFAQNRSLLCDQIGAEPNEVLLIASEWQRLSAIGAASVGRIQKTSEDFWNAIERHRNQQEGLTTWQLDVLAKVLKRAGKVLKDLRYDDFQKAIPIELFLPPSQYFNQTIGNVFLHYQLSKIQEFYAGLNKDRYESQFGAPPWSFLQEIIDQLSLPFTFNDPSNISLLAPYIFELRHKKNDLKVEFEELSSGEKVIFSLVFWLYHYRRDNGLFPKLMLLDEPDAHLHPSMTKTLLQVLQDIVVEKCGIPVIITTHSPSTVALAPSDSVFQVEFGPRISKVTSISNAIQSLTAGFLAVSPTTRYVFVEDKDDVEFYGELFRQAVELNIVDRAINLMFISSAGRNKNRGKVNSGGRSVVETYVSFLTESAIETEFFGLVDKDMAASTRDRVFTVGRYCIENYLFDPIVVFVTLLNAGKAPPINGISVRRGQEFSDIEKLDSQKLQLIANHIHEEIQPLIIDLLDEEKNSVPVKFSNGIELRYPRWSIESSGKGRLRNLYFEKFRPDYVSRKSLIKNLCRIPFIPDEIAQIFKQIQYNVTNQDGATVPVEF